MLVSTGGKELGTRRQTLTAWRWMFTTRAANWDADWQQTNKGNSLSSGFFKINLLPDSEIWLNLCRIRQKDLQPTVPFSSLIALFSNFPWKECQCAKWYVQAYVLFLSLPQVFLVNTSCCCHCSFHWEQEIISIELSVLLKRHHVTA